MATALKSSLTFQNESDSDEEPEMEPWVNIQRSTFTNWVNDKLRLKDITVQDIRKDFRDGIKLCRLAEVLIGHPVGRIVGLNKARLNHYEASGNLALALEAFQQDKVRLVNIGAEDIAGGNLKLILGMMWSLIRRYQLGNSRLPPKRLMLSWINATLHPHLEVNNFSTDWNDGKALHGVLNYCKPGLAPDWHTLRTFNEVENCRKAMSLAEIQFGIPLVVSPEHFASSDLDELSGMTYMSYFMMKDAPGYDATLDWVRRTVHPTPVQDFSKCWNDGRIAAALAYACGAEVPRYPDIDTSNQKKACNNAITASMSLDVPGILTAADMASPDVDHIAVMAYAAWHRAICRDLRHTDSVAPQTHSHKLQSVPSQHYNGKTVEIPEIRDNEHNEHREHHNDDSPSPPPVPPYNPRFSPEIHDGSSDTTRTPSPLPVPLLSTPPEAYNGPEAEVTFSNTWRVNATTTIKVDSSHVGPGIVEVLAMSPSGELLHLEVERVDIRVYHAIFRPKQKGVWNIDIHFNGKKLRHSPYRITVYDTSLAKILKHQNTEVYPGQPYSFQVDLSKVGISDVDSFVSFEGQAVPVTIKGQGQPVQHVTFTPESYGVYDVHVYCGGSAVPGSPFNVEVGAHREVSARGEGLRRGIVGKPSVFSLDLSGPAAVHELSCIITDQHGEVQSVIQKSEHANVYNVTYTPQREGKHIIDVRHMSTPVIGSPFDVQIRKPEIYVRDLKPVAYLNHNFTFYVDASEMAKGALEIDSDMPLQRYDPVPDKKKCFYVTCVPQKTGHHNIIVRFNNQPMAGPYEVNVVKS